MCSLSSPCAGRLLEDVRLAAGLREFRCLGSAHKFYLHRCPVVHELCACGQEVAHPLPPCRWGCFLWQEERWVTQASWEAYLASRAAAPLAVTCAFHPAVPLPCPTCQAFYRARQERAAARRRRSVICECGCGRPVSPTGWKYATPKCKRRWRAPGGGVGSPNPLEVSHMSEVTAP